MDELSTIPNLTLLLNRYESIGGIVEYVVLERGGESSQDISLHRQAAVRSLDTLGRRQDRYFELLLQREEYKGYHRNDFFRVESHPELLSGHKISLSEFLGPYFDLEKRCLILRGRTNGDLNSYFYAGDTEISLHRRTLPSVSTEFATIGYAQAFSEPPHNLRATHEDLNALFLSIADELFCGFHCPLSICQWSTNWSNYFDAGHEWWGSFLWTVEPEGANYIVGIVASTTD